MAVVRTRRVLDIDGAQAVREAAEAHAREHGYRVVIAVVDPAGDVLELRRTPDAQAASRVHSSRLMGRRLMSVVCPRCDAPAPGTRPTASR